MNIKDFQKLSRPEQGEYIYQQLKVVGELLDSIELETGETLEYARGLAEACGCDFCDQCEQLTDEQDEEGLCATCARESARLDRELQESARDLIWSRVNVFGGK